MLYFLKLPRITKLQSLQAFFFIVQVLYNTPQRFVVVKCEKVLPFFFNFCRTKFQNPSLSDTPGTLLHKFSERFCNFVYVTQFYYKRWCTLWLRDTYTVFDENLSVSSMDITGHWHTIMIYKITFVVLLWCTELQRQTYGTWQWIF
jgi:hypothetical protein